MKQNIYALLIKRRMWQCNHGIDNKLNELRTKKCIKNKIMYFNI